MVVAASGHEVDIELFEECSYETAVSMSLYDTTIPKFLIHCAEIISNALLPIGYLSYEARNKDYTKYRLCYSRKMDRVKSNQDNLNMSLISSDPIISTKQKLPKKNAHLSEGS